MSQDFETPEPTPSEPTPSGEFKKSGPRLKIPVPPDLPHDDPDHGSPHRRLSTMVGFNFLLSLILILMLAWMMLRPANAPSQASAAPSSQPEETKALASEVDRLKGEIAGLSKKLGEMPAPTDPSPQIKSLDDKIADLGKSVSETPARLEALSQKVEAATKGEGLAPAPKVEELEKKVGDLTQAIDALKSEFASRPGAAAATTTAPAANAEGQAMSQAVELFKLGRYGAARDAFGKLQSSVPDDARVWYFSALANGLATRSWQGESERLVKVGVEKEKAGSPPREQIDSAFEGLNVNNGRDWLAYYRKQAAR